MPNAMAHRVLPARALRKTQAFCIIAISSFSFPFFLLSVVSSFFLFFDCCFMIFFSSLLVLYRFLFRLPCLFLFLLCLPRDLSWLSERAGACREVCTSPSLHSMCAPSKQLKNCLRKALPRSLGPSGVLDRIGEINPN